MCGDKAINLQVVCPQNGTGVLKGLGLLAITMQRASRSGEGVQEPAMCQNTLPCPSLSSPLFSLSVFPPVKAATGGHMSIALLGLGLGLGLGASTPSPLPFASALALIIIAEKT